MSRVFNITEDIPRLVFLFRRHIKWIYTDQTEQPNFNTDHTTLNNKNNEFGTLSEINSRSNLVTEEHTKT